MTLAERLVAYRKKYDLSPKDMANLLDLRPMAYARYEHDFPPKTPEIAERIEAQLRVAPQPAVDSKAFAKKLESLRTAKELTSSKLAELVGVSGPTIRNYAKGSRPRHVEHVYEKLAEVLGCTPEYLEDDSIPFDPDYLAHHANTKSAKGKKAAAKKAPDKPATPKQHNAAPHPVLATAPVTKPARTLSATPTVQAAPAAPAALPTLEAVEIQFAGKSTSLFQLLDQVYALTHDDEDVAVYVKPEESAMYVVYHGVTTKLDF